MNGIRRVISLVFGVLALAALAGGAVLLLRAQEALPRQEEIALPAQPASPLRAPTPIVIVEPTSEVWWPTLAPSPTPRPWPIGTPLPIPTPPKDPSGTILYVTFGATEDQNHRQYTIHAVQVDEAGQPVGEPRDLASIENCGDLLPSPDGRYLATSQGTPVGMAKPIILDLESGRLWPVFDPEGPIQGFLHGWHPDSRHILFSSEYTLDAGLWLVDIETGEYSVLAGLGGTVNGGAAVSPDGTLIAYTDSGETWLFSVDGQRREQLDVAVGYLYRWSPDGSQILSLAGGANAALAVDGRQIQIITPDSISLEEPTSDVRSETMLAAWSPDGQTIAATQVMIQKGDFDPFAEGNIYLLDVAGGGRRPLLLDGSGLSAAWSPDGSMLAFLSNRGGSTEVWLVNADGTGLRQLTHEAPAGQFNPYLAPVWVTSRR
jgi:WD40 repeat protein